MTVAVEALVHARDVAQSGCRPFRGDRAFLNPTDGWGVVNPGSNGRILHVSVLSLDGQLTNDAGVLQVAVGDGSRGVCSRHESVLDRLFERVTPDERLSVSVEVDSAHAGLSRVSGAQQCRFLGHDLG